MTLAAVRSGRKQSLTISRSNFVQSVGLRSIAEWSAFPEQLGRRGACVQIVCRSMLAASEPTIGEDD